MFNWIRGFFSGSENSSSTAVNASNVSSAAVEVTDRYAKLCPYFSNASQPCDRAEVRYYDLNRKTCPAPLILIPAEPTNTKEVTIISKVTLPYDFSRYPLVIVIMFLSISLFCFIKWNFTKKKTVSTITPTILVVGANKTGKKSVIAAFKDMYAQSKTWNFITQDFSQHRIPSPVPDLILLVMNYQASIHENEFTILQYANQTPVILVINKVDLLQDININNDSVIRNFNEHIPNCLRDYEKLMNIRERLIQFEKPIVILSLRQGEDGDKKLGMDNLIEITNESLLKKNLGSNSQSLFDYKTVKHELESIRHKAGMKSGTIKVLLIGYSSTGKSSLVNCLAGRNVASVSLDGLPMTLEIKEYLLPDLNLILVDSMGLEKKRDNTEKLEKLKNCCQPDFIWFLLNYQSSIEQEELNLINELFPSVPTIIVLNFMDILQTFDHDVDFETETQQKNQNYQIEKQRLLQFKQIQRNVRHIIAISLRSEEHDDRPRGLTLLYEQTIKNFLQDNHR